MIFLNASQTEFLLHSPESGMGYQFVEVAMKDGPQLSGVAYNAELLLLDSEPRERLKHAADEPVSRMILTLEGALQKAEDITTLRVVTRAWETSSVVRETAEDEDGPAADAPVETTEGEEEFKRFSAFLNDRRVTANRGLLPGSYATTAADAVHVATGTQAVSRYALPNPTPAIHRFTIQPPAGTNLQRGIAHPAYGQPGGGVEVIFTAGSPDHTVTLPPDVIPP
jgi:hypothetical protein